jgi:hypothetical protein
MQNKIEKIDMEVPENDILAFQNIPYPVKYVEKKLGAVKKSFLMIKHSAGHVQTEPTVKGVNSFKIN